MAKGKDERMEGRIEKQKEFVTEDEVREVWGFFQEAPAMDGLGITVLRSTLQEMYRDRLGKSVQPTRIEAILKKGVELEYFAQGKGPKRTILYSPLPRTEASPTKEPPAAAAPAFSYAPPKEDLSTIHPDAESFVALCQELKVGEVEYLRKSDVLTGFVLLAEERDEAKESLRRQEEIEGDIETNRRETQRLAEKLNAMEKELATAKQDLANSRTKANQLQAALEKTEKERDRHKGEAERLQGDLAAAQRSDAIQVSCLRVTVSRDAKLRILTVEGELQPDTPPHKLADLTQAAVKGALIPIGV